METAHTPGPWVYSYHSAAKARKEMPGTDGGGATGFIQKPTGKYLYGSELRDNIAFMPHNRDVSKDAEHEANARLMAAAPCLLKALRALLSYDTDEAKAPAEGTREAEVYDEARKAISLATKATNHE